MPGREHKGRRLVLAAALALATTPSTRGEGPAAGGPAFDVVTTAGPAPSGRIAALSPSRITIAAPPEASKDHATTELIRLSRRAEVVPIADAAQIVLPEGDRVTKATLGTATDEAVEVLSTSTGKTKITIDALLGLVLVPPTDPEAGDRLIRRLRTEPRTSEIVWLTNGDRIAGTFLGMDDRTVRLQVDGVSRELARDGVTAIGFDPALVSYPKPKGAYLEIGLSDGSRLGLVDADLEAGRITGELRFGGRFDQPIENVVLVTPRTPAVVYLSERPVDARSYTPYFDLVRPFQVDADVEGRPMLLGGRRPERGLGTSSRTLLAFKLQPGDRRFQATVGVDERAGPLGNVVFRVLTDGKERFATPAMTSRDAPVDLDVDLDGAKLLILATEFGERGDVRDLADWAEARIIRFP